MSLKEIIKNLFVRLGGDNLLRILNQTPRILFWHGVDTLPDSKIEAESISKDDFLKQIMYLRKYFNIISMDDFHDKFNTNNLSKKDIVLTFDDGYKNNLKILAPIMREMNIPYTVFITTNNIENGNLFPTSIARIILLGSNLEKIYIPLIKKEYLLNTQENKKNTYKEISNLLKTLPHSDVNIICKDLINNLTSDEVMILKKKYSSIIPLTWEEVKELDEMGATIGSHCIDHICCHSNQNKEEVKYQIEESKRIIEDKLQKECKYFAYPNGNYTDFSNDCVSNANYKLGFSTKINKITYDSNKASIPRISVPFNINTFKILVNLYPKDKK